MTEPARILKANDLRGLGSKIAFNYEDLRRRCDEHLEQVRAEARKTLAEASADAKALRERAHQEGLAAGRREGLQQADVEINRRAAERADLLMREKLQHVLPALQSAAHSLEQERDRWLAHWETAAVQLSVAIAEKLLRAELRHRPDLSGEMIAQALQLAAGSPQIRLRLHPADLALLGSRTEEIVRGHGSGSAATLVPDEAVSRGGCLVETGHGTIDGRLETQLQRILGELLPETRNDE